MRLTVQWVSDNGDTVFQSTHPVWDATSCQGRFSTRLADFNPRIPYGMRHAIHTPTFVALDFNPRIPYGMRPAAIGLRRRGCDFNPRIPYGMRLSLLPDVVHPLSISIHASRMGCDITDASSCPSPTDFNPRIPYGMRLREWTLHSIIWKFLPALRADYIADIPEHLSVCIFGL